MSHSPGSSAWRDEQRARLLAFGRRAARDEGGFSWLSASGEPEPGKGLELWINARMTYVFGLAALAGDPSAGSGDDWLELASHGVRGLSTLFHDDEHGGWYDAVSADGTTDDTTKRCYGHAHVLLAATVASRAGADGGDALLEEAARVHLERFWDADAGRCVEELSRDWSEVDDYRGANSNMHTVEAYLFAADVTGDPAWLERAEAIAERIVGVAARAHDWRIPEHYDRAWNPLPDYNADRPADPFRPYGATPGHAFEWSRLLVQLAASQDEPRPWITEAAEALFARAVDDTVDDDTPGLPYTTDWDGEPVVAERFHWVMAEAVLAAEALQQATGQALHRGLADRWWSEIDEHFVDATSGSWHHELSTTMEPSTRTWVGEPDVYHAFNAVTLPGLPLAPCPALTIEQGVS